MQPRDRDFDNEPQNRLETERTYYPARRRGTHNLFEWSSVWTGVIASLAITVILGALVTAVGFAAVGSPTSSLVAVVWAIIVAFLGFFFGSWLAGYSTSLAGRTAGLILGSMIWALGTAFLVLVAVVGLSGLAGAIRTPAASVGGTSEAAAVGTLVLLVVTYIASVIGAMLGTATGERTAS